MNIEYKNLIVLVKKNVNKVNYIYLTVLLLLQNFCFPKINLKIKIISKNTLTIKQTKI